MRKEERWKGGREERVRGKKGKTGKREKDFTPQIRACIGRRGKKSKELKAPLNNEKRYEEENLEV